MRSANKKYAPKLVDSGAMLGWLGAALVLKDKEFSAQGHGKLLINRSH